jgi:hypothetical protein
MLLLLTIQDVPEIRSPLASLNETVFAIFSGLEGPVVHRQPQELLLRQRQVRVGVLPLEFLEGRVAGSVFPFLLVTAIKTVESPFEGLHCADEFVLGDASRLCGFSSSLDLFPDPEGSIGGGCSDSLLEAR